MFGARTSLLVAIAVGLFVGVTYPYVDLALACREPMSEACVWGKAYFPLKLGLSLLFLGAGAAGIVYAALAYWRKSRRKDDAA